MSSFEEDIQNMFEGAEFQPSDKVWAGVEAGLAPKKKKGIFFMWQTYGIAAGIAAVLSFGLLLNNGFFNDGAALPIKERSEVEKTLNDTTTNDPESDKIHSLQQPNEESKRSLAAIGREGMAKDEKTLSSDGQANLQASFNQPVEDLKDVQLPNQFNNVLRIEAGSELGRSIQLANVKPYRSSLAAVKLMFNSKMDMEPMTSLNGLYASSSVSEAIDFDGENSINGSLGNSVLNISSTGSSSLSESTILDPNSNNALNTRVESGQDQALGAISAGLGVSLQLNRKLSLNLGARYSEFRFKNSSNAYSIEGGKSLPIYVPVGFSKDNVFFVGDYDLENTVQSMFLQGTLSYKVLDLGKFDLSINAGVGIDYFLAYKVKGELNFLETRKVNASESDFLNRTNMSGVSGLGLNYRLNNQFGLSGDISYRRFLTGSGTDVNAKPSSVLGFGLSLNYFLTRKEE